MGRIGESATLAITRRVKELQAAGREILDLGAGEPDFDSPPVAVEAAGKALRDGFTRYTENAGTPELRRALAERFRARYGAPWGPSEVLITVGAKAGLFELAMATLEPGREFVVHNPCWVSFPEQARFAGAEVRFAETGAGDGFRIHAAPVIECMSERTGAVLINSPCNPTGGTIAAADLRQIVEACNARGAVLVYDETYERFVYDGAEHASAAALAAEFPETVVVVGSFSKTYAMTGWRLGYALGPKSLISAAAAIQSHMTSNPTSFAMRGAAAALDGAEADVRTMIAEYAARRELMVPKLCAIPGWTCAPPAGAFYLFPRVAGSYREGRQGSVALCEFLLDKAGVAVVPGAAFGADDHVRISFASSRQTLEQALDRIAGALATDS
jgi:aspartate aminotransferase